MALEPLVSEFADFCPVCGEMAVLCWHDSDLNEPVCEDCAQRLAEVEHTLRSSSSSCSSSKRSGRRQAQGVASALFFKIVAAALLDAFNRHRVHRAHRASLFSFIIRSIELS